MVPNVALNHGRKLETQEKGDLFQKISSLLDYTRIIGSINQIKQTQAVFSDFKTANKLEFVYEDEVHYVVLAVIELTNESLLYFQETKQGDVTKYEIIGSTRKDNEFLTFYIENEDIQISSKNYDNQLEKDYSEGLPDNEDYVEGESLSSPSTQAWYDGCYPFYSHCGADCGDNGSWGGGTPLNPYDNCCRAHDRCWYNFGTNDCDCDCSFLSCAKSNFGHAAPALHVIVLAAFPMSSSCSC